jgi:hypothetical protein
VVAGNLTIHRNHAVMHYVAVSTNNSKGHETGSSTKDGLRKLKQEEHPSFFLIKQST